jgi:GTP-binding protein EngB required for normal cell division
VSSALDRRLEALAASVELAEGRLDPEAVGAARAVVERAGRRLGLGLEVTAVALAGPTGAGKSSLFNALAGSELVTAGRIRPTTSTATAAVWGDGAGPLLDWLEVPVRHAVARDGRRGDGDLVVLDLPDFDSVQRRHREEVDRVVELVDLMVWVVDPQKYADATLHDGYLRPLSDYRDSMVVVLNQADTLAPEAVQACLRDLDRQLGVDGLAGIPVLSVSARTGAGVGELRALLERQVRRREAALDRLAADLSRTAAALGRGCDGDTRGGIARDDVGRLLVALEQAAGVPSVVRAIGSAHRRRGSLSAGWPPTRWVRRARPDPLRRLRLGDRARPGERTSLPPATPVQRSQVSSAIRVLAAGAVEGHEEPWPSLARSAAARREDDLADRLDRAVGGAELTRRDPLWWKPAAALQLVLILVAALGALWLLGYGVLGYLQISDLVATPQVEGMPVPTLMLVGGALAGLLLAVLARIVNSFGSRRRERRAQRVLRQGVRDVASELVLDPLEAELRAREALCAHLRVAAGRPR